ncbi:MAG: aspartate--tRNA(Asn) ligase [Spirochaetaceae bacterium]|jgi:nondiscriminating aspartyl-tRNA synthetase|nr:aspartate--tRNA(Asn) ligase [Spirochaetaceae bacterium]
MRLLVKDMIKEVGNAAEVEVCGWVHRIRELGGITFVILRDRSGLLQLVCSDEAAGDRDGPCTAHGESPSGTGPLTLESVIRARGIPAANEKAPGGVELRVRSLEIISRAEGDLPYQVNGDSSKVGLEALLDNRALSLRNPKIRAIFKIQAAIIEAFSAYLRSQDFTEIKTSKLVGGGTEGGAELFEVEYFDRKVYLAQSPQIYKQIMVASGLERVFEVAPAYRAEKHDTPRHLNEYVSLDVEMGFIESELDLIELEKGLLSYIFAELERKNRAELDLWNAAVPDAASVAGAPVIPYEEAVKLANAEAAKARGGGGRIFDINPEAERLLCEWALREKGTDLVFVNRFPRRYRPFYAYPWASGTSVEAAGEGAVFTMSFDALFRGLEITTGGRRQHDYQALLEALPKFGLKEEDIAGYRVFKYGCPPHGGFAIGCERLTQKILGLANVKEASLFPRDRKRVSP